jgi:mono/diheme cytochrome c family protein
MQCWANVQDSETESQEVNTTFHKEARMIRRAVGLSALITGCALVFSGGLVSAEDLPPLPQVPPEYADKKMPAGGWTDAKAIEEGGKIYRGEVKTDVNCSSCHGKDGAPAKKGARDLRDPKLVCRFSDAFWFWRVSEGVPKTKMKANKHLLTEEQIWQVMAYENQFSHGGKPADRSCYKP